MKVCHIIILNTCICLLLPGFNMCQEASMSTQKKDSVQKTPTTDSHEKVKQPPSQDEKINRQIEEDMQKEIEMLVELDNQESDLLLEKVQQAQQAKDDHVEHEFKKEIENAPKDQTTLQTFEQVYAKKPLEPEVSTK